MAAEPTGPGVAETLERWLREEGLGAERAGLEGFDFAFRSDGSLITRGAGEDKVVIATAVELSSDAVEQIGALKPSDRQAAVEELAVLLHARSVNFRIDPSPESPRRITIAQAIYTDGFTKDRFMSVLRELRSTTALVTLTLSRLLRRG